MRKRSLGKSSHTHSRLTHSRTPSQPLDSTIKKRFMVIWYSILVGALCGYHERMSCEKRDRQRKKERKGKVLRNERKKCEGNILPRKLCFRKTKRFFIPKYWVSTLPVMELFSLCFREPKLRPRLLANNNCVKVDNLRLLMLKHARRGWRHHPAFRRIGLGGDGRLISMRSFDGCQRNFWNTDDLK